jgi:hypothetical protein
MRRLLFFLFALLTVSASSGAQATGTSVMSKPRGAGMGILQYRLQVLSGSEATSLLTALLPFEDGGGVWQSSPSVISVVGSKRTLAIADSVLKSYDHAPATLVFEFMLIAATDSAVSDPSIGEVDGELRQLLKFNGYRRLAQATSVVAENADFTSTLSAADLGAFTVQGGVRRIRDGRVPVQIQLRSGTTQVVMGVATSPTTRELLSTAMTVPLGQTVVLGTAAGYAGVAALILTVKPELPKMTERQSTAPANSTGTYKFRIHSGTASFEGILHVLGDSMDVDSPDGICKPDEVSPRNLRRRFYCTGMQGVAGLQLLFDVHNLMNFSKWQGYVGEEVAAGQRCIRYSQDPPMKNACLEWQPIVKSVSRRVGDKILFESAPAVGIANSSTSATKAVGDLPRSSEGTYEFKIHFGSASFDGIVRVLGDSVEVESPHGYCVSDLRQSSLEVKRFNCEGLLGVENLVLAFDIHNLRERSNWWGRLNEEPTDGRECVQYRKDPKLGNVCIAWGPKITEVKKIVRDRIMLTPKPL